MNVTEEKIKQVAIEIFSKKGFAATKTRDIASAANVNISTLHYYYRNKDTIYKVVADEVFHQFNQMVETINTSDLTFKERIRQFVFEFTDLCIKNPHFPSFLVFESQRNPEKIFDKVDFKAMDNTIERELNELIAKKIIRPISYPDYALNISGLVCFPFINKHMLQRNNGLTNADFNDLVENRKELVADMIIDYLYLKEKG
ncbi:TetR/AcrR family transcriptional regulator [Muricauda sp. SCSIO 64092]|uniref:TetR/AcrR family transcriptional regulator n=1 Tax=Allomuricauda sp. SCSIO 64092 TaxID=2908842 RepID=UPI001FF65B81|nr:TetR/AcrR family transcriptional regulator [Muricauda sp. SCSIO 64092]UOY08281.1 TetR/AcrR family transcriptional regulator [Muricauda sp. SCSIO 64092]